MYGCCVSSWTPPGKVACSITPELLADQAPSMGNKWEGLGSCVWSQGHGPIAITEMWWDRWNDWNAGVDGYTLRKMGQQGEGLELLFT